MPYVSKFMTCMSVSSCSPNISVFSIIDAVCGLFDHIMAVI